MANLIKFVVAFSLVLPCLPAYAGITKWFKTEVVPTVSGQRPLRINPNQFRITVNGRELLVLGPNSARIRVAGVTLQTRQLRKRLIQAGCIYATGGDVFKCAPDVVLREMGRLQLAMIAEQEAAAEQRRRIARENAGGGQGSSEYQKRKAALIAKQNAAVKERERIARQSGQQARSRTGQATPSESTWVPAKQRASSTMGIIICVAAKGGWQPVSFTTPVNTVEVVDGEWSVGRDSQREYSVFPVNAVLLYVEGLGVTQVSGKVVFPEGVKSVMMRINDQEIFDNTGSKRVRFSFSAADSL